MIDNSRICPRCGGVSAEDDGLCERCRIFRRTADVLTRLQEGTSEFWGFCFLIAALLGFLFFGIGFFLSAVFADALGADGPGGIGVARVGLIAGAVGGLSVAVLTLWRLRRQYTNLPSTRMVRRIEQGVGFGLFCFFVAAVLGFVFFGIGFLVSAALADSRDADGPGGFGVIRVGLLTGSATGLAVAGFAVWVLRRDHARRRSTRLEREATTMDGESSEQMPTWNKSNHVRRSR